MKKLRHYHALYTRGLCFTANVIQIGSACHRCWRKDTNLAAL